MILLCHPSLPQASKQSEMNRPVERGFLKLHLKLPCKNINLAKLKYLEGRIDEL